MLFAKENVALIDEHADAVEGHHRFSRVRFHTVEWDLTHLTPYARKVDLGDGLQVVVVVLFSCHCFTHAERHDGRASIPEGERFHDGRERRILNEERYLLSRRFLPRLVDELAERQIRKASDRNFVTFEATDSGGKPVHYSVFFEVRRDARRAKRLLLRVESAYPQSTLTKRERNAGKVSFRVLLRAAYQGRKIRG